MEMLLRVPASIRSTTRTCASSLDTEYRLRSILGGVLGPAWHIALPNTVNPAAIASGFRSAVDIPQSSRRGFRIPGCSLPNRNRLHLVADLRHLNFVRPSAPIQQALRVNQFRSITELPTGPVDAWKRTKKTGAPVGERRAEAIGSVRTAKSGGNCAHFRRLLQTGDFSLDFKALTCPTFVITRRKKMISRFSLFLTVCLSVLTLSTVHANFHQWNINEVYSNADGSVQFIELFTGAGGQQFVSGHTITSTGAPDFTFPSDSPSPTGGHNLLLATGDINGGNARLRYSGELYNHRTGDVEFRGRRLISLLLSSHKRVFLNQRERRY
jgi:hypothetical protein